VRLFVTISALILIVSACSDSSTSPRDESSVLRSAAASPNPNSVLSAVVTFGAAHAESASVSYSASTDPGSSTPWYRLSSNNTGRITVLGLLPNTTYNLVVTAAGHGHPSSQTVQYTTEEIPAYVQRLVLTLSQGQLGPGFTLLASLSSFDTTVAIAYDSIGRIRWYRMFPGAFGGDLKMQRNGHFTAALLNPGGSLVAPGAYTEFTPDGNIVATYDVPVGDPDFHDF